MPRETIPSQQQIADEAWEDDLNAKWTDEDERRVAELLAPPAPDARCTICKLEWVDAANGFDTCKACLKRQ